MQVFDKGVITDDKGQSINFKNTIILLTSNVGTDTIMTVTGKGTYARSTSRRSRTR